MFAVHNNNNWVTDVLQSGGRDNWEGKEESERGEKKKKDGNQSKPGPD